MLARNPTRMDYQRKYEEIVADYNREKDRTTIEKTFRRLVELAVGALIRVPDGAALMLGVIYWLVALLLTAALGSAAPDPGSWQGVRGVVRSAFYSPVFWTLYAALAAALWANADAKTPGARWALGFLHAAIHMAIILALVSLLPLMNGWLVPRSGIAEGLPDWLLPGPRFSTYLLLNFFALSYVWIGSGLPGWFLPGTLSLFCLYAGEAILLGGIVGSFVWGTYLMLTCGIAGIHDNDAFSAMRLGWYRHFLRLRIKGDELTIYPIGIDRPPRRSFWQWNPKREKGNQNQPEVIPKSPLNYHLIEGPIVIRAPEPKTRTVPAAPS